MKRSIMFLGTASGVGKSIMVTAFCRIFTQDGYNVFPFKAQNMSLNSYIGLGGEMGRAQVAQAEAALKIPEVRMNPVLLKPDSMHRSQLIVLGRALKHVQVKEYYGMKPVLFPKIVSAYQSLLAESDVVVLEGAGSPAEINLKEQDIVNMKMAEAADANVILIGDIDKGGVFASLYGTVMLLDEKERKRIKGFLINKFRGDASLLLSGIEQLEELTGIPVLGVIPYGSFNIEEEDSIQEPKNIVPEQPWKKDLHIGVIRLSYVSNLTDINPLYLEPGVQITVFEPEDVLPPLDGIIIPGTKSTAKALQALRKTGMDKQIINASRSGAFILGICGGYQLLGEKILDINAVESDEKELNGLGLLQVDTIFEPDKTMVVSSGKESRFGTTVSGYEIHMGKEVLHSGAVPWILKDTGETTGAYDESKKILGTYFHGILEEGAFRRNWLNAMRRQKGKKPYEGPLPDYNQYKQEQYNKLAAFVRRHVDMAAVYKILAGEGGNLTQ